MYDAKVIVHRARGCCDAIPNGDTADALASDPEYGRDDDDGGVEWKLPPRSAYFVWADIRPSD